MLLDKERFPGDQHGARNLLDVLSDAIQETLHLGARVVDGGYGNLRPLMKVVIRRLRDRDPETLMKSLRQSFDHASFVLQATSSRDVELENGDRDDHVLPNRAIASWLAPVFRSATEIRSVDG